MATQEHRFEFADFEIAMHSHANGATVNIQAWGPVEVLLRDSISLGLLAEFTEFVQEVYEAAREAADQEGGEHHGRPGQCEVQAHTPDDREAGDREGHRAAK